MLAELGVFFLVLALLFALALAILPLYGVIKKEPTWMQTAPWYLYGQGFFLFLAFGVLILCFLRDDFSLPYVYANSSLTLPFFYKLCAVWGGHEGSMLLWVVILQVWMWMLCSFSKTVDATFRTLVFVILGWLSAGFLLFLLCTSNPFLHQFQPILEGKDLNPLLQDIGFLFHPPMLYMGYVGFSVAFSFAIATLILGRWDAAFARWTRPWTLAAFCCLTAGITLGSWWAYRELGWGGWWFWDPVENASFMPWLAGVALIHSLIVSEKKNQWMIWTVLLAIAAFSLSLIGTFLVRSGVLTSVHAFAVDPLRGMFILGFLVVVIGGSLLLFALRAQTLKKKAQVSAISKENALLLNNLLLTVITLTILLGTIYPLIIDGLGWGKLSVGAPYFNTVFVPLMLPLLFLMGVGIHLRWQKDSLQRIAKKLALPFGLSLVLSWCFLPTLPSLYTLLGLTAAFWILLSTLSLVWFSYRQKMPKNLVAWGMIIAHIGVGVTVLGITVSSSFSLSKSIKMQPGESIVLGNDQITFRKVKKIQGPNYQGIEGVFEVQEAGNTYTVFPQKRLYTIGRMAMTESAIHASLLRDVYIVLGEEGTSHAFVVNIYIKPLVRFIWAGGFCILLGAAVSLVGKRRR